MIENTPLAVKYTSTADDRFHVNTIDTNGRAMNIFCVVELNWLMAVSPPNLNEIAYKQAEISCSPMYGSGAVRSGNQNILEYLTPYFLLSFLISCILSCWPIRSPLDIAVLSSLRRTFVSGAAACERAIASDEDMNNGKNARRSPMVVAAMVAHHGRPVVTWTASRAVWIRSDGHQPSHRPTLFRYPHWSEVRVLVTVSVSKPSEVSNLGGSGVCVLLNRIPVPARAARRVTVFPARKPISCLEG
ncbi:hypothetical protein OGAPHI_003850 [Ogataea philodendri]|uniref:Uncharacterized protein n=1 Tax=Ogataea philodendri TaxID=1378263 RepID=A0A9P8P5I3_9ASCO|nr:uncharacterized protein OGAPHI_003850 [Ogataea philodendri]KAH3665662.1 hypothetical protein OGAPHI_003850 [Ogataea philodendri]